MSNMQHVKKMVLIPHDEYNCWKDCKKLGISSPQQSDSVGAISGEHEHGMATEPDNHSEKPQEQSSALTDLHKELISKVGSTLLDLLVTKGTKGLMNLLGRGDSEPPYFIPPPPGEPDVHKKKRNLVEEKQQLPSSQGSPEKQIRKEGIEPGQTGSPTKVTWKSLR